MRRAIGYVFREVYNMVSQSFLFLYNSARKMEIARWGKGTYFHLSCKIGRAHV